ncbi:UNVERIFIED_CONTAM: Transmembrane 9 superfamily member 1 [Sesamum radiatum]|uniref:Transmembrane 9 superfamily member n=1 Tax=Sesamum radiatum TaxID=300843 RepID=A0AAW2SGF8_SESRA
MDLTGLLNNEAMRSALPFLCVFIFFFAFLFSSTLAKYQADETVTLWVNKVGPYNNPQETYNYYSLPFCHPHGNAAHKWGGLGDVEKTKICEIELDAAKAKQFKDAIDNSYWFEFFMGTVIMTLSLVLTLLLSKLLMIFLNYAFMCLSNFCFFFCVPSWVACDQMICHCGERDVSEESGWKLVHGDVFRPPQSLATISCRRHWRGAIVTTFIVCYAFTSFIAGYVSGGMYSRNGGKKWIKSMILTASLFPFLCFGIGFILNTVAIFYGSLAAIPFGTMVVVFVIWAFISFPLALLGTVIGRNWSGAPNNPCRVKTIPRPIPEKKWYLTPSVISLMGGLLLPISTALMWSSLRVYYVYGFMLLVFVILIIVTICVTIVGTYFLLNAENYHWQWTSFFSAASTALYVYFYSIYYYHVKTKMSGFFQTSFYFGYTLMFCLGLGILCGAVGYLGSNLFVRRIYRNIKCD